MQHMPVNNKLKQYKCKYIIFFLWETDKQTGVLKKPFFAFTNKMINRYMETLQFYIKAIYKQQYCNS